MQRAAHNGSRRGATSIQILVFFVPVFFGFMGFAVDLGRLYMIRGELKSAADSMALAAAQRLVGTEAAIGNASASARLAISAGTGRANRYDFGGVAIGEGAGILTSSVPEPGYFETAAAALGTGDASGSGDAGGSTAKHATVTLTADAPLLFWAFLSLGQERKTPISVKATAGVSAPLCTACGIEPIAVAALDPSDDTDFGFIKGSLYTFGYQCNGPPAQSGIAGAPQRIPYLLVDRYDDAATIFTDEASQLFRSGAIGLPPNATPAKACISVNATEIVWANATPIACAQQRVPLAVTTFVCGMASRMDTVPQAQCTTIPEVDTIASAYVADTDVALLDDYTQYTGSGRRVITIPIVDALAATGMTVIGFRQFVVQPNPNDININSGDSNARFVVGYVGSSVPLKQGTFAGCSITRGPGKVVLHQ